MIPYQLSLNNFLSYREATLDFRGLHTACICGPNGAGKSSLLEAIAWSIWGESRAGAADDIIHLGEKEARVDFIFEYNHHIYRVIRSRQRGQGSSLEFQVDTGSGFRPLSGKGVQATQELILQNLKLDYETFVNSAYLRQGRADEFMLKRPSERKQVLASLLRLDRYDELSEEAKERSRQFKAQVELLERNLASIQEQLATRSAIAEQQSELEVHLTQQQQQQDRDRQRLQHLQTQQHQRQTWQHQLNWYRQQFESVGKECDRLHQELTTIKRRQQELEALLHQEHQIAEGYAQFQQLQAQEDIQGDKWQLYQAAQQQRQQLQHQQAQQLAEVTAQLQQAQGQLGALVQQEGEIQEILAQGTEIEAGMLKLQEARDRLSQLDHLQMQVTPLLQRRQQLQTEVERTQARMSAHLEELHSQAYQLQVQQQRQPQLQQAVVDLAAQIEELEKKRVYLQRVREKGLERRSFLDQLQVRQRDYEMQLAELDQKIQQLVAPRVGSEKTEMEGAIALREREFPVCPLCDRPLDEHHHHLVWEKTQQQRREVQNQLWVVREQLAVSEREIKVLRHEYRQLDRELAGYDSLRERRGELQAQLNASAEAREKLAQILSEKAQLERSLHAINRSNGETSLEMLSPLAQIILPKLTELHQLEDQLQQLSYNEENHALARTEEKRLRWIEIKQSEIQQAQRRFSQLQERKPELEAQIAQHQITLEQLRSGSEFSRQIAELDQQLAEINYDVEAHNKLRAEVRQAQVWLARVQELHAAQEQYPQLQQRAVEIQSRWDGRSQEKDAIVTQIDSLNLELQQTPDATSDIQILDQQIQQRRTQLDEYLAQVGRIQQQLQQLDNLQIQSQEQQQQLKDANKQQRVYQELAQAFGKNGIQALMIENVLPQLEAETNQILSRLSANQLHVQFVTQRAGRSAKSSKKTAKLIDTLDILIADARGTRPYETYSGGEAFRINFAIRLALSRILAHRSGTALQMLIVDEGFGTQDAEGCNRLIAAINAIAPEFACILTVTHMPQFKEAFQARIEVTKAENGSQIRLSV